MKPGSMLLPTFSAQPTAAVASAALPIMRPIGMLNNAPLTAPIHLPFISYVLTEQIFAVVGLHMRCNPYDEGKRHLPKE